MSADSDDSGKLWDFVQVDEYSVPSNTVSVGKFRKGFREFFRKITKQDRVKESPLKPEDDLSNLSEARLKYAIPRPDWSEGADRLAKRLQPWLESAEPSKPAIFYLSPPFSGRDELLTHWAELQNMPLVAPPRQKHILGSSDKWFRNWPKGSPWILPNLEKCFLRRADGLDLIRELLSRVLSGELGKGIIGCDGWAWSFLQQVWLGRPSFTITAQALDAERMKNFFYRSILRQSGATDCSFRQADNGVYMFQDPAEKADRHSKKRSTASDYFWQRLAEYSRGNLGVASACWQQALRALPEEELEKEVNRSRREQKKTIWVTPWNDLTLPTYPKDEGETALFVLHALLIHDGLDLESLAYMLPADRAGVTEVLLFLRESELVEKTTEQTKTIWRVTAAGYPVVRKELYSNEYLCDPF